MKKIESAEQRNSVLRNLGLIEIDGRAYSLQYPCIIGFHKVQGADGNVAAVSSRY